MADNRGYSSLIQYCPDYSRLEVANIDVALFCPELRFLKARMANGGDRIRRFFHDRKLHLARIEEKKAAIAERIELARTDLITLEDLKDFIVSRGNDILLTPARPVKVQTPTLTTTGYSRSLSEEGRGRCGSTDMRKSRSSIGS